MFSLMFFIFLIEGEANFINDLINHETFSHQCYCLNIFNSDCREIMVDEISKNMMSKFLTVRYPNVDNFKDFDGCSCRVNLVTYPSIDMPKVSACQGQSGAPYFWGKTGYLVKVGKL